MNSLSSYEYHRKKMTSSCVEVLIPFGHQAYMNETNTKILICAGTDGVSLPPPLNYTPPILERNSFFDNSLAYNSFDSNHYPMDDIDNQLEQFHMEELTNQIIDDEETAMDESLGFPFDNSEQGSSKENKNLSPIKDENDSSIPSDGAIVSEEESSHDSHTSSHDSHTSSHDSHTSSHDSHTSDVSSFSSSASSENKNSSSNKNCSIN